MTRLRQYIEAPRGWRFGGIDNDIEGIVGIYVFWDSPTPQESTILTRTRVEAEE